MTKSRNRQFREIGVLNRQFREIGVVNAEIAKSAFWARRFREIGVLNFGPIHKRRFREFGVPASQNVTSAIVNNSSIFKYFEGL